MEEITKALISGFKKNRLADSHKGTYGHAMLIAGTSGKMGAAVIATRACLKSGVGLVTVDVPFQERYILQIAVPEAMAAFRETFNEKFDEFSAVGIGPGIGKANTEKRILATLMKHFAKPIILDADALNIMAASKKTLLLLPKQSIITPHPKEFDRLFGLHKNTDERIQTAIAKAKELQIVVVLKGHHTLVTNGDESYLNNTGNTGLAKGGSGDALTGLITGFAAQGYLLMHAALMGVYIHGAAADIALQSQSEESMLVTDVIDKFGEAFKNLDGGGNMV